jgi:hypothetical protein
MNHLVMLSTMGKLDSSGDPIASDQLSSPERISSRYEQDDEGRTASGYTDSTYKTIFDRLELEGREV